MKKSTPLIVGLSAVSVIGILSVNARDKNTDNPDQSTTKTAESVKPAALKAKPLPPATEADQITSHKDLLFGKMPNGMRYVLMKNDFPKKRASLRLHVNAGSLDEKENQRGIAHFLEHMVFNGTKNFPDASKLIPQMQRLGIAFGAHANAYTSFDETVYMLDLPDTKETTMDLAFKVMHDFADGALLEEKEIDEERGVISSEKTSSDSLRSRILEQMFQKLLPDSKIGFRFPIGTEEVIQNATRERFTEFYDTYYTPENMTFILVGDYDLATAEQQIFEAFSKIKQPEKASPPQTIGKVPTGLGLVSEVFSDKEVAETEISLFQMLKASNKPDTVSNRIHDIKLSIVNSMIDNRLHKLTKGENALITSGSASSYDLFKQLEFRSIDITVNDHKWEDSVKVLENEFRRIKEHGFLESELNQVVSNLINDYEYSVESADTWKSDEVASSIVSELHEDNVFSHQITDLEIAKKAVLNLSVEELHEMFKKHWDTEDLYLTLTTNNSDDSTKATLKKLFTESQQLEVVPNVEEVQQEFGYPVAESAGEILKVQHVKDIDIHQLTLANGIKVNFKKTDFEKNDILITARIQGGKISQPLDKPGLSMLAGSVINGGGLGKHSNDDLEQILAGKNVSVSFSILDDSFSFSSFTTSDDLTLQLQLLCASITDQGYRPEAERVFRNGLGAMYTQMKHTESGSQSKMSELLKGNDPRFITPDQAELEKRTTAEVKEWLSPALKENYLELSIAGDFDIDELLQALKITFAALPDRVKKSTDIPEDLITLKATKTPYTQTLEFESKLERATGFAWWRVDELNANNIGEVRRLSILSSILGDRMRVKLREELGEAYSPGGSSRVNEVFKNSSYLVAYCPSKPEDAEKLTNVILDIADDMATNGVTEDEMKRALTPLISGLEKGRNSNSYWLNVVLANCQAKPERLSFTRSRETDFTSITTDELNNLAKRYLKRSNSLKFIIVPKKEKE